MLTSSVNSAAAATSRPSSTHAMLHSRMPAHEGSRRFTISYHHLLLLLVAKRGRLSSGAACWGLDMQD
jgi:hypothetical protein